MNGEHTWDWLSRNRSAWHKMEDFGNAWHAANPDATGPLWIMALTCAGDGQGTKHKLATLGSIAVIAMKDGTLAYETSRSPHIKQPGESFPNAFVFECPRCRRKPQVSPGRLHQLIVGLDSAGQRWAALDLSLLG